MNVYYIYGIESAGDYNGWLRFEALTAAVPGTTVKAE